MELIGSPVDARTLSQWMKMIAQQAKTIDDFRTDLLGSPEYTNRVQAMYEEQFYTLMGRATAWQPDVFTSFMRKNAGQAIDLRAIDSATKS